MLVCALGDLMLDVIARLDGPLAPGGDAYCTSALTPGGQAANVAAWVAALGGTGRLIAKRAASPATALAADGLRARGVDVQGPQVEGRAGVVVSLVAPDGDRTMVSDRGVAPDLEPGEIDPAWLEGAAWLHLSGYSLMRDPISAAASRAAELARAGGARVSVDLSSWSAIRAFGPPRLRERLAGVAPDVIFANQMELDVLGDPPAPTWVHKRGPGGAVLHQDGAISAYEALPARAIDATGAGDAFAAGFLLGGAGEGGMELGLEAARRCVEQAGAMP